MVWSGFKSRLCKVCEICFQELRGHLKERDSYPLEHLKLSLLGMSQRLLIYSVITSTERKKSFIYESQIRSLKGRCSELIHCGATSRMGNSIF